MVGTVFAGLGLLQFIAPQVGQLRTLGVIDKEIGDQRDSAKPGERLIAYFLGLILVFCGSFFLWLGIVGIQM